MVEEVQDALVVVERQGAVKARQVTKRSFIASTS
jgi:hypothetical protein